MRLRVVIVEDEPLAVRRLQIALGRIAGVELIGTASDGHKALELISASEPDLILLDIKMPVMDGFDLMKALAPPTFPEIIFVTAYSEFAIKAFEAGAVGYVLKPIDEDRLRTAVERARLKLRTRDAEERLAALSALVEKLQLREGSAKKPFDQELWIDSGTAIERIAMREVDWFEAAGDYVAVHSNHREHLLQDSLRSLVERLDPDQFVRVHRKAIVRLDAVRAIERTKLGTLILCLASCDRIPVSRTYKQSLLSRIRGRDTDPPVNMSFGDEGVPVGDNR
jgi:DNA-binding LytR/AlgR family response regulator